MGPRMLVSSAENNVYIITIFFKNTLLIFNFWNSETDNTPSQNVLIMDTELDANVVV